MKQIHTEQSDENSVPGSVVLTNRMSGNNVGRADQPELPKRVRSEWAHSRCSKEVGGEAVVKCSDSGMQQTWVEKTWFRVL